MYKDKLIASYHLKSRRSGALYFGARHPHPHSRSSPTRKFLEQ